ncbi:MAG: hypothetical protein A4E34_02761 [Methanoregula sp. PtaU1.Bin006]|nr:MAG: hypothetical protein A4E33_00451 [Methanoregula sp. PtaB.Bin085]OPY32385.1 MAG: hypothetical protein A4E34_02761 [Methanoregula sp. PtaU1.Bin006]
MRFSGKRESHIVKKNRPPNEILNNDYTLYLL